MKSGAPLFLLAIVAFVAWILHQFVLWNTGILEHTSYLTLPPEVWSTASLTLAIGLAIEGYTRVRKAG